MIAKKQKQYIEMTPCNLNYFNPALPTSIMILRCVPPLVLAKLNQVTKNLFRYGT